jgi:hypothetical protein
MKKPLRLGSPCVGHVPTEGVRTKAQGLQLIVAALHSDERSVGQYWT